MTLEVRGGGWLRILKNGSVGMYVCVCLFSTQRERRCFGSVQSNNNDRTGILD